MLYHIQEMKIREKLDCKQLFVNHRKEKTDKFETNKMSVLKIFESLQLSARINVRTEKL